MCLRESRTSKAEEWAVDRRVMVGWRRKQPRRVFKGKGQCVSSVATLLPPTTAARTTTTITTSFWGKAGDGGEEGVRLDLGSAGYNILDQGAGLRQHVMIEFGLTAADLCKGPKGLVTAAASTTAEDFAGEIWTHVKTDAANHRPTLLSLYYSRDSFRRLDCIPIATL